MRIAGLVRVHDYKDPPLAAVESILPVVDGLFILVDSKRPEIVDKAVRDFNHPKLELVAYTSTPYKASRRFQEAFDLVEDYKPDIVIFPDEDEPFSGPEQLIEDLECWDKETYPSLMFEFLYTWRDQNTIAHPDHYHIHAHCKAVVYKEEFMNWRNYRAKCQNRAMAKFPNQVAKYPIRSLQFTTEEMRLDRRRKVEEGLWRGHSKYWRWWMEEQYKVKTLPFDKHKSFNEILKEFRDGE